MKYWGGGASARGLVRLYVCAMVGGSGGMLPQEKVVKYVEDMIFS